MLMIVVEKVEWSKKTFINILKCDLKKSKSKIELIQ